MNKRQRPILLIVILVLIVGLIGPAALPGMAKAVHAHPLVQQLAAANPDALLAVIVQKADASHQAEQLTTALGGAITKDLHIINAFAAEMSAGAALELAASPAVRWVSPDASVVESTCVECIDTSNLVNAYVRAIGADRLWNEANYLQGQNITVAVVDSGVETKDDLKYSNTNTPRILNSVRFNSNTRNNGDQYGHGTAIAGVIAGNGKLSGGTYIGIAPKVNLVNVKISDDQGMAVESDVVSGLQWVLDNKTAFNIRVVNLSLNSSVVQSYLTSPLDAALEILWFNGIVAVVSAGNNGQTGAGVVYPPANDPFVITVGAVNDKGTPHLDDDELGSYSAYGVTMEGISKPDLVAPGSNLITLAGANNSKLFKEHPGNRVDKHGHYFRMSGTSIAAPVVAGAVALLLQDEPNLTPDQVKYRLMATANKNWPGYSPATAGAGYLDVYAAANGTSTNSANTGTIVSLLLLTGDEPIAWNSVAWNSVAWNSVAWNSVAWNSVAWNSVAWNSDYWGP